MNRHNPKLLKLPYQFTLLKSRFFVFPNSTHLDKFNKEQSRLTNSAILSREGKVSVPLYT